MSLSNLRCPDCLGMMEWREFPSYGDTMEEFLDVILDKNRGWNEWNRAMEAKEHVTLKHCVGCNRKGDFPEFDEGGWNHVDVPAGVLWVTRGSRLRSQPYHLTCGLCFGVVKREMSSEGVDLTEY